jgi:hypothetical protein
MLMISVFTQRHHRQQNNKEIWFTNSLRTSSGYQSTERRFTFFGLTQGVRIVLNPAAFTAFISFWVVYVLPHAVSPPVASRELPRFQPMVIALAVAEAVTDPMFGKN